LNLNRSHDSPHAAHNAAVVISESGRSDDRPLQRVDCSSVNVEHSLTLGNTAIVDLPTETGREGLSQRANVIKDVAESMTEEEERREQKSPDGEHVSGMRVETRGDLRRKRGVAIRSNKTVMLDLNTVGELKKENLIAEQAADPVLATVRGWMIAQQRPDVKSVRSEPDLVCYFWQYDSIELRDELLYRKFVDADGKVKYNQLLIPSNLVATFLEAVHQHVLCHERSYLKNAQEIQRYGYWPQWKRDLRLHLATCRKCVEYGSHKFLRRGP
jgi:hypothetical protein